MENILFINFTVSAIISFYLTFKLNIKLSEFTAKISKENFSDLNINYKLVLGGGSALWCIYFNSEVKNLIEANEEYKKEWNYFKKVNRIRIFYPIISSLLIVFIFLSGHYLFMYFG
ncbi:MAG: hypothetical protein V4507_04720 [Verrucomicrobiota bacterium]